MTAGSARSISIRQHEVVLSAAQPATSANTIAATVMRHVFLGNSRDYLLALADGSQLRVVTSPEESIPEGDKVWLTLPPQRCRVLVG
jgi:iron(III) transport system ATP-binding protein